MRRALTFLVLIAIPGATQASVADTLRHLGTSLSRYPPCRSNFPTAQANERLLGISEAVARHDTPTSYSYAVPGPDGAPQFEVMLECAGARTCGRFSLLFHPLQPTKLKVADVESIMGIRFAWAGGVYDMSHMTDNGWLHTKTYFPTGRAFRDGIELWVTDDYVENVFFGCAPKKRKS